MSQKTTAQNGGTGFVGLITILFIGLKLTDHINWSWWWVLSPVLFAAGLALLGVVTYFGFEIYEELKKND